MDNIPIFGGKEHPNKHWPFVANSSMIEHGLNPTVGFWSTLSFPKSLFSSLDEIMLCSLERAHLNIIIYQRLFDMNSDKLC